MKIDETSGPLLNDRLNHIGFRRSQNILYRPACADCNACKPVRIPIASFKFRRSHKRILARNRKLHSCIRPAKARREQYDLMMRYISQRHGGGGMENMTMQDYAAMVEQPGGRPHIVEYYSGDMEDAPLAAFSLIDQLADGVSLIYSAYDPDLAKNSIGKFVILDHIRKLKKAWAAYPAQPLRYVYLGYYIEQSKKMRYKAEFTPLETLVMGKGWVQSEKGPVAHFPPHLEDRSWLDYLRLSQKKNVF